MELVMTKEIKTIYDLLRVPQSTLGLGLSSTFSIPAAPPLALPEVAPDVIEDAVFRPLTNPASQEHAAQRAVTAPAAAPRRARTGLPDLVRYPIIFVAAFGFFYVILNLGAFYAKFEARFHPAPVEPQTAGTVLGVATDEFTTWISKYFYAVNSPDAISPNNDFDRDGLTNYQEFLIGTSPIKKDTDNDVYSDGREILNGYNPLYEGAMTAAQQETIREWDLQDINNRISYYVTASLPTGPAKPSLLPVINYDLSKQGEVKIPKLGMTAPLLWPQSENDFTDDLDRGIIHYPGTALPGQGGVSYLSGHSSNYIWRSQSYAHVFARLNELKPGNEFFITVPTHEGTQVLRYLVQSVIEYQPEDQAQFEAPDDQNSYLNLSTCWPIGTIARRLVVSGKLAVI